MIIDNPYPNSWLASQKRIERLKEIGKKNLDRINFEISEYFRTKGRREKVKKQMRVWLDKVEKEIRFEVLTNIPAWKPIRSMYCLIKDKVLTSDILLGNDLDKRTRALTQVLCFIPETDYQKLKEICDKKKVIFQIPHKDLAGSLSRIASFKDACLYLSPILEERSYNEVLNVCAHEIAHLLLHNSFSTAKSKNIQEKEAEIKSAEWGF